MPVKANYTYRLREFAGRNVIIIEDQNLGNTSVTNCIEDVVNEIEQKERIEANLYMIVYKDSDGNWDGWNNRKQQFILLGGETWPHAVEEYIKRQLNSSPIKQQS